MHNKVCKALNTYKQISIKVNAYSTSFIADMMSNCNFDFSSSTITIYIATPYFVFVLMIGTLSSFSGDIYFGWQHFWNLDCLKNGILALHV